MHSTEYLFNSMVDLNGHQSSFCTHISTQTFACIVLEFQAVKPENKRLCFNYFFFVGYISELHHFILDCEFIFLFRAYFSIFTDIENNVHAFYFVIVSKLKLSHFI